MEQPIRANLRISIEIPHGAFFYPCCGYDTMAPLRAFLGSIDEFHFCDNEMLELPETLGHIRTRRDRGRGTEAIFANSEFVSTRSGELAIKRGWHITTSEVKRIAITEDEINKARQIADNPESVFNKKSPEIYQEIWSGRPTDKQVKIVCHKVDAVVTLNQLQKISVFFYRGDSYGEGGSGQWWLGPKLFDEVLSKLLEGGLIITDGSNPDPVFRKYSPWSPLWMGHHDFAYNGRYFKHLGAYGTEYGRRETHVWKVEGSNR